MPSKYLLLSYKFIKQEAAFHFIEEKAAPHFIWAKSPAFPVMT